MQASLRIFHVVNLLLRGSAPEIGVAEIVGAGVAFHAFGQQKVFPESAGIGAQCDRRKVFDDRIADAIVIKIDFPAFFYLVAGIAAERGDETSNLGGCCFGEDLT